MPCPSARLPRQAQLPRAWGSRRCGEEQPQKEAWSLTLHPLPPSFAKPAEDATKGQIPLLTCPGPSSLATALGLRPQASGAGTAAVGRGQQQGQGRWAAGHFIVRRASEQPSGGLFAF